MPSEAGLLAVVLLLGLGGPLALYALVRAETQNRPSMDRRDAERAARRDRAGDGDGNGDDRRR